MHEETWSENPARGTSKLGTDSSEQGNRKPGDLRDVDIMRQFPPDSSTFIKPSLPLFRVLVDQHSPKMFQKLLPVLIPVLLFLNSFVATAPADPNTVYGIGPFPNPPSNAGGSGSSKDVQGQSCCLAASACQGVDPNNPNTALMLW